MSEYILSHESGIRLGFFIGILILMGFGNRLLPAVPIVCPREVDGSPIWGIVVIDSLILRLAFPVTAVYIASLNEGSAGIPESKRTAVLAGHSYRRIAS